MRIYENLPAVDAMNYFLLQDYPEFVSDRF